MESKNILFIVITGLFALALLFFLIRQNKKDKDSLDPDSSDIVDETHMDQERNSDKT